MGLQLFPYQREGVDALKDILTRNRSALLADEPGVGKTSQAIKVAEELQCSKVLIICPATLRLNWAKEIAIWWKDAPEVFIVRKGKDADHFRDVTKMIVITSYSLASKGLVAEKLESMSFDLMILDECHATKSPSSQISRACLITLWARCRYRVALSGTPLPNGRAAEAWTLFSRMLPSQFGSWSSFCSRYCIPEQKDWGIEYPRSKNLEELGRIARESFMVRRKKKDVLGQLPELVRCRVSIDVPALKLIEVHEGIDLKSIIAMVQGGEIPLKSDPLSTARRKLGVLKASIAAEYIKTVTLEETDKVVVFCHHKEVFSILSECLEPFGLVSINGHTGLNYRQLAVERFQDTKSGVRVFLASITAASTGITLTAASTVVFVEWDWVGSTNEQAESRILRIGQQAELLRAIYLVVPDSLDEAMMWSVRRKERDIERVFAA